MSNKPVTLGELLGALKPLIDAINGLRVDQTTNTVQVSELYQMVSNISNKSDIIEQLHEKEVTDLTETINAKAKKPAAKKPAAKKPAAKQPAAKQPAAKKTADLPPKKSANSRKKGAGAGAGVDEEETEVETVEETTDETTDETVEETTDEAVEETVEDTVTVEPPKKPTKAAKKPAAKKPTDATPIPTPPVKPKGKVVASADVTVVATVKPTKAKKPLNKAHVDKPAKPASALNKMEFFSLMYDADEKYFDKHLTAKIKDSIAKENSEAWESKTADELRVEKKKAYYHYMKINLEKELQLMKANYIADSNPVKINLVGKESDE